MTDIELTTYRGFSSVSGITTLTRTIEEIRSGKYATQICEIIRLAAEGNTEAADRKKKTLPFRTLTANYSQVRLSHSITRYNPVITIDVDKLDGQQIPVLRHQLESAPDVLAFFLSPKQYGFKIFVYLRTAYAEKLRQSTFALPELPYAELEKHHALMYEACRSYIAKLLGVAVDESGKDIGRGFFLSFDPEAYLNQALLEQVIPLETRILPVRKQERPSHKKHIAKNDRQGQSRLPLVPSESIVTSDACGYSTLHVPPLSDSITPWEQMEYRKALNTTRRTEKYVKGNRNNFLFMLGNRCYRKGLNEASICLLVQRDFPNEEFDVTLPIGNAYQYTDKTRNAEQLQIEKPPVINQVIDYLSAHYDIRRNQILERIEFIAHSAKISPGGQPVYLPLRAKDYNSIFVSLQMAGIHCFQNYLRAVIDSDFAKDFNPFEDYFLHLPPWDGITDHIGLLADTVQAEDQPFWRESFRRWLVGMVACALHDESVNQHVLILYSEQGKGKSSWIRHLLPPCLREYYRNGMIDPANKDDLLLLSTRLIINMEEFEGARQGDIASLKRIITQESVTERKVYDTQSNLYIRRASFIASTNNRQCMQDMGGNRRFLFSVLKEINYRAAVNHNGIYSQALHLMNHGYRYWYEGDEITELNSRNEQHRMKEPVEENLYIYYRAALPADFDAKWRPAAALMSLLCVYGRLQGNRQTLQALVQVLEKDGFCKRVSENGITEYAVVEYTQEEVSRNAQRQERKEERERGRQEELPF